MVLIRAQFTSLLQEIQIPVSCLGECLNQRSLVGSSQHSGCDGPSALCKRIEIHVNWEGTWLYLANWWMFLLGPCHDPAPHRSLPYGLPHIAPSLLDTFRYLFSLVLLWEYRLFVRNLLFSHLSLSVMPPFLLNPSATPAELKQLPVIHGFFFSTLDFFINRFFLCCISSMNKRMRYYCYALLQLFYFAIFRLFWEADVFSQVLSTSSTYPVLSHLDMGLH